MMKLSDTQIRCNYIQCQLLDDLMQSTMPQCVTIPHGSVLSGLATRQGDLDVVMHPLGLIKYGIPPQVCVGGLHK